MPDFHVFLSHNSNDKPPVRELKQLLETRSLTVWFDEDQLRPGIPWQSLLEAGIKASKSAVVAVGKDGLGPWEDVEMQAALRLAVKDGRAVIPVLLPGVTQEPELPLFLTNPTWVDFRSGFSNEQLDRLQWGITGHKPDAKPQSIPKGRAVVVSSHLAVQWPTHWKQVRDACLRQDFVLLEDKRAATDESVAMSLVDRADVYIGVLGVRYDARPDDEKSLLEREYDRAGERQLPRLVFAMHPEHPMKLADFETGVGAEKLKALKVRAAQDKSLLGEFESDVKLRELLVAALSQVPKGDEHKKIEFHHVSPIPQAPELYVAHPYTLLTAPGGLVGRRPELNWLTDWVAGTRHAADSLGVANQAALNRVVSRLHRSRLFFLVAIGGQGKSALAWH